MPNHCTAPITRGKNKGKVCRDVNRICRHQKHSCPHCGEDFSYKHTYVTHTKCCANSRRKVHIKPKPKSNTKRGLLSADACLMDRLEELEKRNRILEQKVNFVEKQPRSIQNIVVIGNNFYQELVEKLGKDCAVDFFASTAVAGKPLDVVEKLYLEGKDPMHYPIACRDRDFRYLGDDSNVVDDRGGKIIGDIMCRRLQNAYLMASNEIISQAVEPGEGEYDVSQSDGLLDNLRRVQEISGACYKREIVDRLAEATENREHPFFQDCP